MEESQELSAQELDKYDLDCLGHRLFDVDNLSEYIEDIRKLLKEKK